MVLFELFLFLLDIYMYGVLMKIHRLEWIQSSFPGSMPETFLINVISLLSLQYYAKRFVISVARYFGHK